MLNIKELKSSYNFPRNKHGQIEWTKLIGHIPRTECVYGIYHKDQLIYIGTTENFYVRLKRHFISPKKIEFSKYLLDNFSEIDYSILHHRKSFKIEMELISIYQPLFNY
jgi:excinuclease UvrABC nuclease subunit